MGFVFENLGVQHHLHLLGGLAKASLLSAPPEATEKIWPANGAADPDLDHNHGVNLVSHPSQAAV